MNVFDMGGIISVTAVILTLMIGTGLFMLLNSKMKIIYWGFGAIAGLWLTCTVVAAFLVNIVFSLLGGVFSVIWFLVKWTVLLGGAGFLIYYIYGKIKGVQNGQSEE